MLSPCKRPAGRAALALALTAALTGAAAAAAALPYQAIFSAVDIGALPAAAAERGRTTGATSVVGGQVSLPLTELIDLKAAQVCRAALTPAAKAACPTYEWSVPFLAEPRAKLVESQLSYAWNEFDALSTWFVNTLLNGNPDPMVPSYPDKTGMSEGEKKEADKRLEKMLPKVGVGLSHALNCLSPVPPVDPYLVGWTPGKAAAARPLLREEFCPPAEAALKASQLSYVVGVKCAVLDQFTNWPEVSRRYAAGLQQAMLAYTERYWTQVGAAVNTNMTGSLAWSGLFPIPPGAPTFTVGGSQIQPVHAATPQTLLYHAWAKQAAVPGGPQYLMKFHPYAPLPGAAIAAPLRGPGGALQWPGIPALEQLKYRLSRRTDIFAYPGQWWTKPEPVGWMGTGDLPEVEGVGAATFLRLYTRKDWLDSPRKVVYLRWCFESYVPPIPRLVILELPSIAQGLNLYYQGHTRVHVHWQSVPEGYPVPQLLGQPNRAGVAPAKQLISLVGKPALPSAAQLALNRLPKKFAP